MKKFFWCENGLLNIRTCNLFNDLKCNQVKIRENKVARFNQNIFTNNFSYAIIKAYLEYH